MNQKHDAPEGEAEIGTDTMREIENLIWAHDVAMVAETGYAIRQSKDAPDPKKLREEASQTLNAIISAFRDIVNDRDGAIEQYNEAWDLYERVWGELAEEKNKNIRLTSHIADMQSATEKTKPFNAATMISASQEALKSDQTSAPQRKAMPTGSDYRHEALRALLSNPKADR